MIDLSKTYQTADGREVTLHEIKLIDPKDGKEYTYPVKGTICFSHLSKSILNNTLRQNSIVQLTSKDRRRVLFVKNNSS